MSDEVTLCGTCGLDAHACAQRARGGCNDTPNKDEAPDVWVVVDTGVPVKVTTVHPLDCGWEFGEGRAFLRYTPTLRLEQAKTAITRTLDRAYGVTGHTFKNAVTAIMSLARDRQKSGAETHRTPIQHDFRHCVNCGQKLTQGATRTAAVASIKVGNMLTSVFIVWCEDCRPDKEPARV